MSLTENISCTARQVVFYKCKNSACTRAVAGRFQNTTGTACYIRQPVIACRKIFCRARAVVLLLWAESSCLDVSVYLLEMRCALASSCGMLGSTLLTCTQHATLHIPQHYRCAPCTNNLPY